MRKPPPKDNSANLPDNVSDCHNLIKELLARVAELEKQLSRRNRAAFGKKSAKVNASLLTGTGKAIHDQTEDELDAEKERLNIVENEKAGGGRSGPGSTLPTRDEQHHIETANLCCPQCGEQREVIGFEISHQLEFVRTLYENIRHIMYKYACKSCNGQIVTAKKPLQPIDKGLPGPGLLAKIATDKFWLHIPLYRQEQVFTALSLPINRSSMCRWLRGVAEVSEAIVRRMKERILHSLVIQSDATTLPVIKKGLGKTHKAFIWVYRGDINNPYVFYDYSDTEHSKYPDAILAGFKGILQTDGTNKFNNIIKGGATSANCWAHVHCKFEEAWANDPDGTEFPMGVIKSLFDIERVAKSLSDNDRKDLRQRLAKPKLDLLKAWLDERQHLEPPKTKLGEAISYTLNRWNALLVFIDHPFVEISNNGSERSIKPMVLSRRNWLFAGSEEGGKTAATIMSLIETCKRLSIDPVEYMKDVLTRFPSCTSSQIDDFLPDRWLELKKSQA